MPSGSKVVFLITAVVAVALVLGGKCVTATGVGMATGAVGQRQQQQQQQQDWSGDWVGSATNWPKELPPGLVVHFHIGRMPVSNNKCTAWTQQFVVSVACQSPTTNARHGHSNSWCQLHAHRHQLPLHHGLPSACWGRNSRFLACTPARLFKTLRALKSLRLVLCSILVLLNTHIFESPHCLSAPCCAVSVHR
jgi:hypothetical protein